MKSGIWLSLSGLSTNRESVLTSVYTELRSLIFFKGQTLLTMFEPITFLINLSKSIEVAAIIKLCSNLPWLNCDQPPSLLAS